MLWFWLHDAQFKTTLSAATSRWALFAFIPKNRYRVQKKQQDLICYELGILGFKSLSLIKSLEHDFTYTGHFFEFAIEYFVASFAK